ncbi:MAG: LD-carboxypeptidase [Deltaproteobacteria bacterium]|nr:LD-carboxypeptidase [Deltaproteobacteria bacterium]
MSQWLKPKALRPGDCIGIAAPASCFDEDSFQAAVQSVEKAGFRISMRDDIRARHRYLAGPDARRAEELNALLADPEICAIFFARGGYGTQRILPLLDVSPTKTHPKIVVGSSDLTVLHAYLHHHCRWVTFYGPMLSTHLGPKAPPVNWEWLLKICGERKPIGTLPAPGLIVIKPGRADGPLLGGCVALIQAGIKTIYEWPTAGGILFLEDRGIKLYALDRMLTHLKHAGLFRGVKGIALGSMVLSADEPRPDDLVPMLTEFFHDFPGPVLCGLPAGHCDPFLTLPLGVRVTLTTDPPCVTINESAVA